jgi:L-amino acid N-acyltransferase
MVTRALPRLRPATGADLAEINDIYNYFVLASTCTYQEEPDTLAARREWFDRHGVRHPVIVAEEEGRILGWGSLSPYHSRSAYRFSVEDSVYVHRDFHGRGLGSALLGELVARARGLGHRVIIADIDAEQAASVALHEKFGFSRVGRLEKVGCKFGRWLDVVYMELLLASE